MIFAMSKQLCCTPQASESLTEHSATVRRGLREAANEAFIRKKNTLHLEMMEVKKRLGLTQSTVARRLGILLPDVSRIEHSEFVSFSSFTDYLMTRGFDFTIKLRVAKDAQELPVFKSF